MTAIFYFVYEAFLWPIALLVFRLLGLFVPKIKKGLAMRTPQGKIAPWLLAPAGERPVWIHCASFEFEYAKPIITKLKERRPDLKILVTYFSPTLAPVAAKFPGVDSACPSPWDDRQSLRKFLEHHKPQALLLARTDTWPVMLREARKAGVPSLLFSATLPPTSGRARGLGRILSRAVFSQLSAIYCVSEHDKATFASLGFDDLTEIVGDTRYDQVLARLKSPKPVKDGLFDGKPHILIAGSVWEEDAQVLVSCAALTKGKISWVLVPHEPTPEALAGLEAFIAEHDLSSVRYSQAESWPDDAILIVDKLGILAELYGKGRFAFVGGSFRKTVHSVMEPLAAGSVTFVGPHHQNNREALEFKRIPLAIAPGLHCVEVVTDAAGFAEKLGHLIANPQSAREQILGEIERRTGKSEVVVRWVLSRLIGSAPRIPSRETRGI